MKNDNIVTLRNDLTQLFHNIKSGHTPPEVAKEMNKAAGRIISTVKVELDYAALKKTSPAIEFLEGENKPQEAAQC